jgi:hypothetical protein
LVAAVVGDLVLQEPLARDPEHPVLDGDLDVLVLHAR